MTTKRDKYCGCCGRACSGAWCKQCVKHIDPKRKAWNATYIAQHGKHCPYQVEELKLESHQGQPQQ